MSSYGYVHNTGDAIIPKDADAELRYLFTEADIFGSIRLDRHVCHISSCFKSFWKVVHVK